MVGSNLSLTYTIVWSLALANVLGAGLCILLAVPISRLTLIPFKLLAPFMIAVICFAAFQATRTIDDLLALLAMGVLGIYMRRFGWPRPALLIGFVLSTQAETYLYQAVQFYGWEFLTRTGVMIIIGLTVGSIWLGLRARVTETGPDDDRPEDRRDPGVGGNITARLPQLLFAGVAMVIFVVAIRDSLGQSFLGQVFPLIMSSAGALFTAALILLLVVAPQGHVAAVDLERGRVPVAEGGPRSVLESLFWVASLVALTALVGFFAALVLFFVAFLQLRAKVSWLMTAMLTAGCAGFILLLANSLNLRFPGGWLQEVYRLPWPFS
jgi:hypothetical protein